MDPVELCQLTGAVVNLLNSLGNKSTYSGRRLFAIGLVVVRDSKQRRNSGENKLVRRGPI